MDLDKVFRESVRSVQEKSLQDVRFTPELQKKIYHRIVNRKRHHRRSVYVVSTAAACLALTLALFSPITGFIGWKNAQETYPPINVPTGNPSRDLTEAEVKDLVQQSLADLYRAVPGLRDYRIDSFEPQPRSSKALVMLRKTDGEYALVTFDRKTGILQTFEHHKPADEAGQQQSETTAIQQASVFLEQLLGEESRSYQPEAAYQTHAAGYENASVTQVTFQRADKGTPLPYDSITVTVGMDGSILSFGRIDEQERSTLAVLVKTVPELSGYLVESKTPHQNGYHVVMRDSQDREAKAVISLDGADGSLLGYELQGAMEQRIAKAPRQLAIEKATAFLQAVLGKDSPNYQLVEEEPVTFQRYVKELPVLEDRISIMVDAAGKVFWFQREGGVVDQALFPAPSQAIPKEKAEKALSDHLKLRYVTHFPVKRDPLSGKVMETRPLLEYTPYVSGFTYGRSSSPAWWIDAVTGEMKYRDGDNGLDYDRQGKVDPIQVRSPEKPVTVKTKEEAARLLMNEFRLDLKKFTYNEQKGAHGEKIYSWLTESGRVIEVITSPGTGRIVEIGMPRTGKTVTVSQEAALAEAIRFLQKYMDPGDSEVVLAQVIEAGPGNGYTTSGDWEFKFFKSHKGIPVFDRNPGQGYTVTVDPATGKANGFRRDGWQSAEGDADPVDVQLPDHNDIVPAAEAAGELLKTLPLQLAYSLRDEAGRLRETPSLVYMPYSSAEYASRSIHLDAVTGNVVVPK